MSYDGCTSTPSSSTQGRVSGAHREDQDPQGLSGQNADQPGPHASPQEPSSGDDGGGQRGPSSDEMEGMSSGNDSGERESHPRSCGHQSSRSSHSSSNGKDSGMMLETTESNKR